MTDKILSNNIHLIRMAVDHFLWHYFPDTEKEYETEREMQQFQQELENLP